MSEEKTKYYINSGSPLYKSAPYTFVFVASDRMSFGCANNAIWLMNGDPDILDAIAELHRKYAETCGAKPDDSPRVKD